MAVSGLGHVNIRTGDIAAAAAFYEAILGLRYESGAPMGGRTPHWLFDDEGKDIVHLQLAEGQAENTGAIDHIAFQCRGLAETRARLEALGIEYQPFVASNGLTLLFLRDPHNIQLELSFRGE